MIYKISRSATLAPRILIITFFCWLLMQSTSTLVAQTPASTTDVSEPELRAELLEMRQTDQEARNTLIEKQKSGKKLTFADVMAMKEVDQKNTKRIKSIIADFGWPGPLMVGTDGVEAAFLLVQHADSDPSFQMRTLKLLQIAFDKGEVSGQDLALLTDRVLVAEGKAQRYGTQTTIENNSIIFRTIEDSANVDKRREAMGLMSIKEYRKIVKKMYLGDDSEKN